MSVFRQRASSVSCRQSVIRPLTLSARASRGFQSRMASNQATTTDIHLDQTQFDTGQLKSTFLFFVLLIKWYSSSLREKIPELWDVPCHMGSRIGIKPLKRRFISYSYVYRGKFKQVFALLTTAHRRTDVRLTEWLKAGRCSSQSPGL